MKNTIMKPVYLIEIITENSNIIKNGKYLAELLFPDENIFATTNSVELAYKFNTREFAEEFAEEVEKTNEGIKTKIKEMSYDIDDIKQIKIAESLRNRFSQEYRETKIFSPEIVVLVNALVKQYGGLPPFPESKQDYLCPCCLAGINYDALNQTPSSPPKHCTECGQKFDWSSIINKTDLF